VAQLPIVLDPQGIVPRSATQIGRAISWTAQTLLLALAAFLLMRRLAGELAQPLGGMSFVLTILLLTVVWLALRWPLLHGRAALNASTAAQLAIGTAAQLLVDLSLTLPGTSVFALVVGWLVLLAGEGIVWALALPNWPSRSPIQSPQPPAPSDASPAEIAPQNEEYDAADLDDELIPPNLIQQLTRTRLASGGEAVEVVVRCPFEPGELLTVAHVAFCPPLAHAPQLDVDPLEGSDVTVRVTQAETFGARLEIRRSQPVDAAEEVVLRLYGEG
jgi:hypothetical protein